MTILTKPTNEKKSEKVALPVVSDGNIIVVPGQQSDSAPLNGENNGDAESMIFYRRRMSASTTIFLFLAAVAVMLMGILGGVTIYRLYSPSQNRMHFRGMCDIPYDSESVNQAAFGNPEEVREFLRSVENIMNGFRSDLGENSLPYFREEYELDLSDDESYAKINVPDFQDGRSGRFMHDFKVNQSAIIDTSKFRCFVMPLDRETVLPPKGFYDLLQKMRQGYYNIDTERVRQNWRVVTPALNDTSALSPKIAQECTGMKTYMLEKYVSGVFKRSAQNLHESGKFAEFAGKRITEMDLININEVEELERQDN